MSKPLARLFAVAAAFLLIGTGGAEAMDAATVNGETITLRDLTDAMQTLPEYQKFQQEVLKRVTSTPSTIKRASRRGLPSKSPW